MVDKSYPPFLMATNEKIMFVYKIIKILIRMLLWFKQELAVGHWDTLVIVFSCCLLRAIWLDALESQGKPNSAKGWMRVSELDTWLAKMQTILLILVVNFDF